MQTSERGSTTVEIVILVPVLMLMVLLIVYAGRLVQANTTVHQAADHAARAATQVADHRMAGRAEATAIASLTADGVTCLDPQVSVTVKRATNVAPGLVTVRVACAIDRSELAPLAPGIQTVTAVSTEPIDIRRAA